LTDDRYYWFFSPDFTVLGRVWAKLSPGFMEAFGLSG
jgi:hypothetical protein